MCYFLETICIKPFHSRLPKKKPDPVESGRLADESDLEKVRFNLRRHIIGKLKGVLKT